MVNTPFPYQLVGRDWLTRRAGTTLPYRTGLHDEPGVGKTGQAILALDQLGLRRGMIIGPTAIRVNWPREFTAFSDKGRRVIRARHFNDFLSWQNNVYDVIILSFEQATTWARYVHDRAEIFDFLIVDEAHFLKNVEAKRTKSIFGTDSTHGMELYAEWAWILTGTPFPNDPSDIFTQLRFVKALPAHMNKKLFLTTFFEIDGATVHSTRYKVKKERLRDLQDIIGNNFLRRTQSETGVDLPPLTINPFLIEGDQRPILDLLREYPGLDQRIIEAAENGNVAKVGEDDHMMTMRRLIGEAKAIPYAEMLLNEMTSINPTSKIVCFGIHREALSKVRNYLWENGHIQCVTIDGTNTANQREALEKEYTSNPDIRVALVNIKAGGTVLTLTAGHHIDMLETDFVPDNNFQAIKRVHRMTQECGVICRVITLAGSFDEVVQEIVARKVANKAHLEQRHAA
jgi:SWI/SNF-related matrix-associated actin-dependent regulator 1 of chromatin subfamily A